MTGNSIYRAFGVRLGLAAVVISVVFGSLAYVVEQKIVTDEVVDLAAAEARTFAAIHAADLDRLMVGPSLDAEERLADFLVSRERGENGHFAVAELYTADRRSITESARPEAEVFEDVIDRTRHSFPDGTRPSHDEVEAHGSLFMRIVVPLANAQGRRIGYFEGVYRLADARRAEMRATALWAAAGVIGVVLSTTLFLVPVIVSLNRRLVSLSRSLLKANIETLELLGGAIAKRDSDTHHHNFRVTLYAVSLGEAVGLDHAALQELIKGAFLHDVGKIAISDSILLKPGRLTGEEFAVMKTHVDHGVDIITRSDWLAGARPVVQRHHEKFDGSGYPGGLAGEDIPIGARIFAIADVFDALTSKRPYKDPMPYDQAMAILRKDAGSHFDPALVAAFERIAPPLFRDFGRREDESVEQALASRTAQYFGV